MWAAGVIIAMFITVIGMTTVVYGLHPPSHVETIEPSNVFSDSRFAKVGQPVEMSADRIRRPERKRSPGLK